MSPVPTFTGLGPNPQFEDVTRKINTLVMELRNLMLSLDTLNVVELNAEVIIANTITADKIAANTITADKMNVTELSAIVANLGTITAGTITTNASINVGTDARVGNILYLNETDQTGQKGIIFTNGVGTSAKINSLSGDLSITTDGFITLTIGSSQGLVVNKVVAASALKSNTITNNSGVSVVFSGASTSSYNHSHGITSGRYVQTYDSAGNVLGLQQFTSDSHSHTVS